jgi:hypothetical protein
MVEHQFSKLRAGVRFSYPAQSYMKKTVIVNDNLQKNYTYELTEAKGKNFDPKFKPDLSPQEILELGVFGGAYFEGCTSEFPRSWFTRAKQAANGKSVPDRHLNNFGVNASQTREVWQAKGWMYENDPRGWFQWYCRYYLGRRIPKEDARQIRRWNAIRRHASQIQQNCRKGDFTCRPVQRQALLHWAYDSRNM